MERRAALIGALAVALAVAAGGPAGAGWPLVGKAPPLWIKAAIADPKRPQADIDRDAARKPAEMLAFAEVKPGQRIVDLMAGQGYFSRLFANVVGPTGRVYLFEPQEFAKFHKDKLPASGRPISPEKPTMIYMTRPINQFSVPEPVDLVWTSQNYHDMHDDFMGPADLAQVNAAVFRALKPGGLYVVLDHAAPDGSGLSATNTSHRIEGAVVKAEVMAAGFEFVGESNVLRNPDDPRTANVFKPEIRGHTDQFIYKFRKPK